MKIWARVRARPCILTEYVFIILLMLAAAFICAGCGNGAGGGGDMVTVTLVETEEAFPNPMKGFRPTRHLSEDGGAPAGFDYHEYGTVYKHYIKYTDLEAGPEDTVQKIVEWSDEAWKGLEGRNIKVIPRVVIMYPNGPDGGSRGYWPEGLDGNKGIANFIDPAYFERMEAFIKKLGEAWDNDPRVAAIEMGLWGQWGEHHVWPDFLPTGDRITMEAQEVFGRAFSEAFKNKKVMVRYGATFMDFEVGFIWDSFALPDDSGSGKVIIYRDVWRTQMISGEVAYDWGNQARLGHSPDGTLSSDDITDYVIGWINDTHCSSLGWVSDYGAGDETVSKNAARMQKALGYRFVINRASYTRTLNPGGKLDIGFEVSNAGSAPFYYQWPVELSLLDENREPAWRGLVGVDIRNWMPGETYEVSDSFKIPKDIGAGTYTLALSVLDPAGGLPALRFANTNYYNGGRTPLGPVGVGGEPESRALEPFDLLYPDRSLRYAAGGEVVAPPKDVQRYA